MLSNGFGWYCIQFHTFFIPQISVENFVMNEQLWPNNHYLIRDVRLTVDIDYSEDTYVWLSFEKTRMNNDFFYVNVFISHFYPHSNRFGCFSFSLFRIKSMILNQER